jgi:hypothetical protein
MESFIIPLSQYCYCQFTSTFFSLIKQFAGSSMSKSNSRLFHNGILQCVKPVKNNFFSRANSMQTATWEKWKRIFTKHI